MSLFRRNLLITVCVLVAATYAVYRVHAQTAPATPAPANTPTIVGVSVDPTGSCTMTGAFSAPYFSTVNLTTGLQSFCMGGTWTSPATLTAYGSLTLAQLNAGQTIVAANANRTAKILNAQLSAVGGAAATCTAIQVDDTAGTPIVGVSLTIAALSGAGVQVTTDTAPAAGAWTYTTYQSALTAGQGIQILKTGSNCATMTGLNYRVQYTYN